MAASIASICSGVRMFSRRAVRAFTTFPRQARAYARPPVPSRTVPRPRPSGIAPALPELNSLASSGLVVVISVAGSAVFIVCMFSPRLVRSRSPGWGGIGLPQLRQVAQSRDAGKEEVGASSCPHELGYAAVTMAHWALRNGKRRACGLAGAGERVSVVVQSAERGVVQPGVLDEFELPGQVGRQAEEIKPGFGPAFAGLLVAAPTAQEAVQIAGVKRAGGVRGQRVARVRPADVRADGAEEPERVSLIAEAVILAERRYVLFRCVDQGRAAWPSADHLRGQRDLPVWIFGSVGLPGDLVKEPPESADVLLKLTKDQIGSVSPQVSRAATGRVGKQQAPGVVGRGQ